MGYYLPNEHKVATVIELLTAQIGPGPMQVSLVKMHETHQQTNPVGIRWNSNWK